MCNKLSFSVLLVLILTIGVNFAVCSASLGGSGGNGYTYPWSTGSVDGLVDAKGLGNTLKVPYIVVANATMHTIEIICTNNGGNVSTGNAFDQIQVDAQQVEPGYISGNGKYTVPITFPTEIYEVSGFCQNSNWDAIPDSGIVLSFTVHLFLHTCSGTEDDANNDACTAIDADGNTVLTVNEPPVDDLTLACSLPDVQYRDPVTYEAISGILYNCVQI
ncbi:MAG: hypothetical protein ACU843_07960 [Gammaproteobacteria bacterium]